MGGPRRTLCRYLTKLNKCAILWLKNKNTEGDRSGLFENHDSRKHQGPPGCLLSGQAGAGAASGAAQGVSSSSIHYLDTIEGLERQGIRVKVSDISDALNIPRPGVTRTVLKLYTVMSERRISLEY